MNHYLYRHIRLDKYEPFYIGIGTKTKQDLKCNYYSRAIDKRRNSLWSRIVKKTNYKVEILIESNNYTYLKKKEEEFISLYGRKNTRTGTLANLTNGGEGNYGKICSIELKKKRSEIAKNKWNKLSNDNKKKLLVKFKNTVKVIDTLNNKEFSSMKEAYNSKELKFSLGYFTQMLSGEYPNKTTFKRL